MMNVYQMALLLLFVICQSIQDEQQELLFVHTDEKKVDQEYVAKTRLEKGANTRLPKGPPKAPLKYNSN